MILFLITNGDGMVKKSLFLFPILFSALYFPLSIRPVRTISNFYAIMEPVLT